MDPFYYKIKDIDLVEYSLVDNKICKKEIKLNDILTKMNSNQLLHFHLILRFY